MSNTKYADEGSIAHILAAMCLTENQDAAAYIGRLLEGEDYKHANLSPSGAKRWMTCAGSQALINEDGGDDFEPRFYSMEVTEDMAEHVQIYVDMVRERCEQRKLEGAVEVTMLVEQQLPIDHMTGEEGATGTGDVVIVSVWENGAAMLDLIDLKFGRGVEVGVLGNEQLLMYGCGALRNLDMIYDFRRACLTVHQPRLSRTPQSWEIGVNVLREFEIEAAEAAAAVHKATATFDEWCNGPDFVPLVAGDHCRSTFCPVRATCPKLAQFVEEGVGADFEMLTDTHMVTRVQTEEDTNPFAYGNEDLGKKMDAVDVIEDWCKAVRAEVERRLLAGDNVPSPNGGYKLVKGKRGARDWKDAKEAEATMKSMRLKQDEMYTFSLISPTKAEKVLKDSPKRWNRVAPLITQSDGKPSVAPMSDKRPALVMTPVVDDFEELADDLAG